MLPSSVWKDRKNRLVRCVHFSLDIQDGGESASGFMDLGKRACSALVCGSPDPCHTLMSLTMNSPSGKEAAISTAIQGSFQHALGLLWE